MLYANVFCVRLNDRISLIEIHRRANLVSLEQRHCIQLLFLSYLCGNINPEMIFVPPCNTRAVKRKKYKTVKYENVKYRNSASPYCKAAELWDTLPMNITDTGTIMELKRLTKAYFSPFDESYFETQPIFFFNNCPCIGFQLCK